MALFKLRNGIQAMSLTFVCSSLSRVAPMLSVSSIMATADFSNEFFRLSASFSLVGVSVKVTAVTTWRRAVFPGPMSILYKRMKEGRKWED